MRAVCASLLIGVTAAMMVGGLRTRFESLFVDSMALRGTFVAAALLAMAAGVRIPQRFATWVSLLAWQRFLSRGRASQISDLVVSHDLVDRSLYWMVLSVVALCAGIAAALLPLITRLTMVGYEWVQAHFVWSFAPLVILRATVVLVAGFVPLAALGLAVSLVHRLSCPLGRWDAKASAWLVMGAGIGTFICTAIARVGGHTSLTLIAAALPMLIVSLVAATSRSLPATDEKKSTVSMASALPVCSDRWPTLLRASIVIAGGGCVWAMSVWSRCLGGSAGGLDTVHPMMLLCLGLGGWVGSRTKRSGVRSISGFGVSCAAAGVMAAAGMFTLPGRLVFMAEAAGVPACVALGLLGFATAYGHQTLLHRVASRSSAGAVTLSRVLVCGAVVVWMAEPAAVYGLGARASVAMLALLMLALGGTLIIHEPACSPRTRGMRLCVVFAAVALIGVLTLYPLEAQ